MLVELNSEGFFVFNVPFHQNHLAKNCGARWSPSKKQWKVKATAITASFILNNFDKKDIDPKILGMTSVRPAIQELTTDFNAVIKGVTLKDKQIEGLTKAWPHYAFALFWVMGAGKTLSSIALANKRYCYGYMDRVLVVCPNSIKGVWAKEYESKSAIPFECQILEAGEEVRTKWDKEKLSVMVCSTEGFSQGSGFDKAMSFAKGHRTMVILDESSSIKVYNSTRTEKLIELAETVDFKLILTGTNVTQKLHDLYPQMSFLDPMILGEVSYFTFKNRYCVMGGFQNKKVVGYSNTGLLYSKIRPYCHVVRKNEVEGLPPKVYEIRMVEPTKDQKTFCRDIKNEFMAQIEGEVVEAKCILEVYLRMHQIAGGITPSGVKLSNNPKVKELLSIVEEHQGKAIIWAVYLPEMEMIQEALEKEYPGSTVMFNGSVDPSTRQQLVDDFETSDTKRFWISNKTGSRGLTILSADLSIYYSNSFNAEDRLQSEDRNHRIGQTKTVKYVDIVMDIKVDKRVHETLAMKKNVYDLVNESLKIEDAMELF